MATNNSANIKNVGIQSLTSAGIFNGRTITGTSSQVSVANGNGTAANPTLSFPSIIQLSTQPCFFARVSGTPTDVTGDGTAYTVIFDVETFDQGSNYNTGTGIFTAPVTGRYFFQSCVGLQGILVGHTQTNLTISNIGVQDYIVRAGAIFSILSADGINTIMNQAVIPLTAAETVSVIVTVSNGTKVVDVYGQNNSSWFSGALLF